MGVGNTRGEISIFGPMTRDCWSSSNGAVLLVESWEGGWSDVSDNVLN